MRKLGMISAVLVMLIILVMPVAALADEAGGQSIEISFRLGESELQINGNTVAVEKPYAQNNTTMVPVRVISEAFGAKVDYIATTKSVVLTFGDTVVELFLGSTEALVNGETHTLLLAPEARNNTTFVPIRFVSEQFGADVKFDPDTQQITITGQLAQSKQVLDSDADKTRIGDSYYGWTIDYPANLVIGFQAEDGSSVFLDDINGDYSLSVIVYEYPNTINNKSEVVDVLMGRIYGTVVSNTSGQTGDRYYATILEKGEEYYAENRAVSEGNKIYVLELVTWDAAGYSDPIKKEAYTQLLDSFTSEFDPQDAAVKDLSVIQDGMVEYNNGAMGFSIKIPVTWEGDSGSLSFYETSTDGASLFVEMSSIAEGDTLEEWANRDRQVFLDTFLEEYRMIDLSQETTVAGERAIEEKQSFTIGTEWVTDHTIYLFKGDYKYMINMNYPRDKVEAYDELLNEIKASIQIDLSQAGEYLGQIEDWREMDYDSTRNVQDDLGLYTIELPEYWTKEYSGTSEELIYTYRGGSFSVTSYQDISYEGVTLSLETEFKVMNEFNPNYSMDAGLAFVGDVAAKTYTVHYSGDEGLMTTDYWVFAKDGITYLIISDYYDAVATPVLKQRLEDVVASFQFVEE